jgi:hypothetical protein
MARNLKSPIKANPLRQPGQSVREQQIDLLFDKLLPVGTIIFVLWFVAALEWAWLSSGLRPDPLFLTVFAALITLYGIARAWPLIRRLRYLALGYRGERVVGEFLDRLRILGYRVFHDVPGEGGNIDHVIISTRGIYTIETKTRSKPAKGPCKILFDGRTVSMNGGPADSAPIIQAQAQAAQLKRLLRELTDRRFTVRPLVVYPGWFVEHRDGARDSDVWVLSPKGLYKWIEREGKTIPAGAVRDAARKLAAHIRKYQ